MKFDIVWQRAGRGEAFTQVDQHTRCIEKPLGGGIRIDTEGVAFRFSATNRRAYWHMTLPGMHSIWQLVTDSHVLINTHRWRLELKAKQLGLKGSPEQCEEGIVHVVEQFGDLKRYRGDTWTKPEIEYGITLPEAASDLNRLMAQSAEDSLNILGHDRAACLISGGTDSLLTLLALKSHNIPIQAFTVGRSWDEFDPKWARKYCDMLGVPIHLVSLPDNDEGWANLLNVTIADIEQSDFSNVLMAMCTRQALQVAQEKGYDLLWHGHFADDIIGNSQFAAGGYKKKCREKGVEPTAEGWRDFRAKFCMHTIPNNTQVDKIMCGQLNGDWRAIFHDRRVIDRVMNCPLDVTPISIEKILYWEACEQFGINGAWREAKKIGYYTGSGIGAVRLKNPVLSDQRMRDVYKLQKQAITGAGK